VQRTLDLDAVAGHRDGRTIAGRQAERPAGRASQDGGTGSVAVRPLALVPVRERRIAEKVVEEHHRLAVVGLAHQLAIADKAALGVQAKAAAMQGSEDGTHVDTPCCCLLLWSAAKSPAPLPAHEVGS